MSEEIFLVTPSAEYKDTYLEEQRKLNQYLAKNDDASSKALSEFAINDLSEIEQNFDQHLALILNKDKPFEERMSVYDAAPDKIKSQLSSEQIEQFKSTKTKPGSDYWIMKKDNQGNMQYIGEMRIKPQKLDEKFQNLGAKEHKPWQGSFGHNIAAGVETASFLIPDKEVRGKKYIDIARVQFFEKLKEKGIDNVVSKVVKDNGKSNHIQEGLVNTCGGNFDTQDDSINRYVIDINPEKFKIALDKKLGKQIDDTPQQRISNLRKKIPLRTPISPPNKPQPMQKLNPSTISVAWDKMQSVKQEK